MNWTGLWEALHKLPFLALAVLVITGGLLMSGDEVLKNADLRDQKRWIVVACIVSAVIVLYQLLAKLWEKITDVRSKTASNNLLVARLASLTEKEKAILRRYINAKERSQILDAASGHVAALVEAGILHKADTARANAIPPDRWPFILKEEAYLRLLASEELREASTPNDGGPE